MSLRLTLLQTDGNSQINDVYYIDNKKRVWLKKSDTCFVKPNRYDIYAHICKINNINPKTQIFDDCSYVKLDSMIDKIVFK
jgi:hypothetical protein